MVSDREDSGLYSCKTNSVNQLSREQMELVVVESKAVIRGPKERFLTEGSNLLLHCVLELGKGPNTHYKQLAVLHWFHNQRLLDPDLNHKGSKKSLIDTRFMLARSLEGWLSITKTRQSHSGNYSCVPSYATPDWTIVHILPGKKKSGQVIKFPVQ